MLPDLISPIVKDHLNGSFRDAEEKYNFVLPLINFENRQCGFRATKTIFKEGKVIKSDFCRHPIEPLNLNTRNELLRIAKNYDLVALNWGK